MRALPGLALASAIALIPAPSLAQDLHLLGVDGMTQTVKQEGQSSISGLSIRARLDSDDLPLGMSLMPSVEYWRDADHLEDFNIRSIQRDLTLAMDGRFDWQWGRWQPYAGGGLGLHFLKTEFRAPDLGVEDREQGRTKIGPDAFLGLQLAPGSWLQSFVEAKYHYVPPFRQFKLNWGFGVNF